MKRILLSMFSVLLLTVATISATYAYYQSTVSGSANAIETGNEEFDVIYNGGEPFDDSLKISTSRSDEPTTSVTIRMAPGSALAKANLYININEISSVLASDKLIWEVEYILVDDNKKDEGVLVSGDFSSCTHPNGIVGPCQSGDKLYIVTDYDLTYNDTEFFLYIWIDGNKATNDVVGATFSGYVGAETENVTGHLS